MKLLFLTSRLPYPPNRGDRLRTYNLLRELSTEHRITLVSFVVSKSEAKLQTQLLPYCERIRLVEHSKLRAQLVVAANSWRRQPLQALYYRSAKMQQMVDNELAHHSFDAVYVHLFRMAPYVQYKQNLYRIVDLTDVISAEIAASLPFRSPLSRLIYRLEQPRIADYECRVAGWAEETWLVSDRDRSELAKDVPTANLYVVPNGIDFNRFYLMPGRANDPRLIFVGHLDVFHNIDAAHFLVDELFPLVRQKIADCTLDIVGPGTGFQLTGDKKEQGIRVRGFVPDLNQALNEAAVFIAPLRFSAGVQNKVLEAMAAGLPAVTTKNVSEGLAARPGQDLLVGESTSELADAIVWLLENEQHRRQLGQAGQLFVRQRFSWQAAVERLRQIEREKAKSS